ncbi:uncharacterized protein arhgef49 isoform X2 [Denticeps clupeoides]|uniref:uncharacterized protein arhgef49 isoform X2 n=1 Tax=Denticeps clupeoides TaxID=299321 RepID=UPI0010A4B929|nr:uncharacterized protein LOC114797063 isoform X2 [Denticeps clupeoides]
MPDVKAPACEYSAAGSPVGCSMDLEHCLNELQPSLSVLSGPYPDLETAQGQCPLGVAPSGCGGGNNNNNGPLSNMGLRYCSTSSMHPSKYPEAPLGYSGKHQSYVNTTSSRLFRSMENLHWAVSDPSLYALGTPYRSVDSEFILHCTSTSHWYDGPPEGSQVYGVVPNPESLAFYPRRALVRRDLPLFPQWLFPPVEEWGVNGNARKGLRDKLRLQSARVSEPHMPLRPQAVMGHSVPSPQLGSTDKELASRLALANSGVTPRTLCARRITSPEEIKQEVLRRLQLRRQNSSPNLALHSCPAPGRVGKSCTSEPLAGSSGQSSLERKRPPIGRLHIPTFEEFKRMRQKESSQLSQVPTSAPPGGAVENCSQVGRDSYSLEAVGVKETIVVIKENDGVPGTPLQSQDGSATGEDNFKLNSDKTGPICTGPTPRSPLHSTAASAREGAVEEPSGPRATDVSLPPFPPRRESSDAPSSCCPALLLDGTDLSSYGAKIYSMKDGILGSALDLIKKSCSAEIAAEASVRLSRERGDNDGADITPAPRPSRQSVGVAMTTTTACGAEARDDKPAGQEAGAGEGGGGEDEEREECSGPGCRRSSSDAAYEPAESVRAQRECRLRPHYSDPMPTDAAKRKQLEMKIAAAARLHSQRRDRDGGPASVRGRSEPRGEERFSGAGLVVSRVGQHRWSTVSSLSADSGVVGLSDEREDEEEPRQRSRHSAGAEVERVDSGIGPGLARGWKRPLASTRGPDAHRLCPDCGQKDGSAGESMCERCAKLRTERKEAIMEFLNTESSYGEDLRIIKEEFYCPMQNAGLLTNEQLAVVFSNVQELIDFNDRFTEHLQESIDQAFDQGDEDLLTVCIGEIFVEFANMLPAFQTYCLQQSTSVNMLNTLEKEKELLRIFLDVSQNDNTALRRMNLRSFLMAPLQRVTKYPLLLSRISKATAECHPDYARLREAKSRVESHLEHINMKTKQEVTATWSLRSFRRDSRKNREVINIEMRELSMKTVGWTRESTRFVMEGPLQLSQPADGQWVKKGSKSLKFQNVQSLLMVQTQQFPESTADGCGPRVEQNETLDVIRDGVLVLIKDKSSGKFTVLREPIHLGNCVVSAEPDCEDTFEVLDIRREAFVFRASDKSRTQQWFRQIKRYACDLGLWKKRRNALPNIMINTTQSRS